MLDQLHNPFGDPIDFSKLPDIWELYHWERGGQEHCQNLRKCLMFLASPSTLGLRRGSQGVTHQFVHLVILGPKCDDGEYISVEYTIWQSGLVVLTPRERVQLAYDLTRLKFSDDPSGTTKARMLQTLKLEATVSIGGS